MRVLFIYPDLGSFLPRHFQHGIGSLSAVLKNAGHQTRLFYLSELWPEEKLIAETKEFDPGLIALSGTSHQFPYLAKIAKILKPAFPRIPIIAGGVHAMLAPEEVMALPEMSIVCIGEGEKAIMELANALSRDRDYFSIENLWVRSGDQIKKNPICALVENLDELPFADREIFNYQQILDQDDQRLSLLVGRGCPYDCSYCANQGKRELYQGKGKYVRFRSVDHLLNEIEACARQYRIKSLDFNDDIFTLNRNWMKEFFEKYPSRFHYPFRINVHAGTVDREIYRQLGRCGCEMARIGVESGSARVRREIMNRRISREEIIQSFQWAEQAGIKTWSFNMVGLPAETAEDALATYHLNRALCPDHMQVSVFNPYPGTRLDRLCKEKGYLQGEVVDGYFVPESVLKFPSLSPEEIHHWHQKLVRLGEFCRNQKALKRKFSGRKILFDLIDRLALAEKITPVPDYYGEEYIIIYEEERRALIMHPPCRIFYQLELREPAQFQFGIFIHPGVYEKGDPGGVIFKARAGSDGKNLKEIFQRHLDAKAKKSDRGFFDFEIDLPDLRSGRLFLELETGSADPEKSRFNTAGLTNPVIVARARPESEAKIVQ